MRAACTPVLEAPIIVSMQQYPAGAPHDLFHSMRRVAATLTAMGARREQERPRAGRNERTAERSFSKQLSSS